MVIQDRVNTGLETLKEEYRQRFAPAHIEERCLVDSLAISEWQSRRYMRLEAAIWEHAPDAKALDRLHRMMDSTRSTFLTSLKLLMDIQAKRAPKPASSGLFVVPKR